MSNFLVKDGDKAEWGVPEGYPYKEIGTILNGTFEFENNRGIYKYQITDKNFTIVDGKSYTVIWDGVTYQCVATIFDSVSVLGNLGIMGIPDSNTGEPFLFAPQGGQKLIYTTDTVATHTVIVLGEKVYPIATEFLNYPIMLVTIERGIVDGNFIYSTKFTQKEIRDAVQAGYTVMGYCFQDGFLTLGDLINQNELRFSTVKSQTATTWLGVAYAITNDGVTRKQVSFSIS